MQDAESKSLTHTIKTLDLGKQYNVRLFQEALTTVEAVEAVEAVGEERRLWYWYVHRRTRNVKNYIPSLE